MPYHADFIFGTSPHLITGPTAVMSIMVRVLVRRLESCAHMTPTGSVRNSLCLQIIHSVPTTFNGKIIEPLSHEWAQCAFALALFCAIIQLLMGFFRIGFFMNFVSEPVIAGFTSAAALLIASSQVCEGMTRNRNTGLFEQGWHWQMITVTGFKFNVKLLVGVGCRRSCRRCLV